jgi:esterase/lipase superfamily enzyme
VAELFTLKLFNRAICNLAAKGLVFTTQEFTKHSVIQTLAQFVEKSQIELFMVKLKMAMLWLAGKDPHQDKKEMCEETR